MRPPRDRCPTCGFAPTTVSPSDAAATCRSLPRRYRTVLVRPADAPGEDLAARRPPDGGLSAVEHAALAAEVLGLAAVAVRRVAAEEEPDVSLTAPDPGPQWSADVVLVRLATAATHLAEAVDALHGDEWNRLCRVDGDAGATALDVARAGAHNGVHRLREAERVIEQVRVS